MRFRPGRPDFDSHVLPLGQIQIHLGGVRETNMEINTDRSASNFNDRRAEIDTQKSQRFAGSGSKRGDASVSDAEQPSDLNTRLSKPVDDVDISDEARAMKEREERQAD